TLNVNTKYDFRLETLDTTHGFGLYNDENQLIIQAQIVPDYTTHLVVKFDEAGVYTVKCMEFCGVAHHIMEATITVV
ncbi:MAG: cytochrome C oxidase subunit II, partial [Candidatus Kariarchaeaceae archaeon]